MVRTALELHSRHGKRLGEARNKRLADARAAVAAPVYFAYDRSDLSPEARRLLDAKAPMLSSIPALRLRLTGHADDRGSDEYNLALGQRRDARLPRRDTRRVRARRKVAGTVIYMGLLFGFSASCVDLDEALEHHPPGPRGSRFAFADRTAHARHDVATLPGGVDSVIAAAEASLRSGRPWRATELLAPLLRDTANRPQRAVLVAARAAVAWRGWDEAVRLLAGEPWLDSQRNGEAHALLARAALETGRRNLRTPAVAHGRRAVAASTDSLERASRLVVLARALTVVAQTDSARSAWIAAASWAPEVADWLLLRAAGLTASEPDRRALFARLTTDIARARTAWVEAEARERAGDRAGAAQILDSLGAPVEAIRIRLSMRSGSAGRASLRRELAAIVASGVGPARTREATRLLDSAFSPLTAREQLLIARNAANHGPASRAATGFSVAFTAELGTARDRYTYGRVLAALGRHDHAIDQFTRAARSPSLAGQAQYQLARSLLRTGRLAESRSVLRALVRAGTDPTSSAAALFLLADLATDQGRDQAARAAFRELANRFPNSAFAPRAAFQAAIIAYVRDSISQAAREFDALGLRRAQSNESVAATYWAGRAWDRAGDSTRATERWQRVVERQPYGYYAMLARRRMRSPLHRVTHRVSVARTASVESAIARAALLERLGLKTDARREYDYLEHRARRWVGASLSAAAAFQAHDNAGRGIRLATEALSRTRAPDAALYRFVYPLPYEETIRFESDLHGIDPALVAGLIRQESAFFPSATSAAGARGLMQIMPAVGRQSVIARSTEIWSDALLYQPDVNLRLGTAHLASVLERYQEPARALAAYNAGESRVNRWARKHGTSDAEVFIERIPYVETRDYVRIVLRNMTWYQRLYSF